MDRQRTVAVRIGSVTIGGGAPIVVQAMTNTDTADAAATARQARQLAEAGAELVRLTVNTDQAAAAVPEIRSRLDEEGCQVPLVGDFHYNGHLLLTRHAGCARLLEKYRINPGNVGSGDRHDANFATICGVAAEHGKAIRIGVNAGSLDPELVARAMRENAEHGRGRSGDEVLAGCMLDSALRSVDAALQAGLPESAIVVSCKLSRPRLLIEVYRQLARRTRQPLHLGLTEAGMGRKGLVWSAAAMAVLLAEGIGDTVRVSLTPRPGGDRREEVWAAQDLLQALELRSFAPAVTACPGCGRTTSTTFQCLAERVEAHVEARMPEWRRRFPGVERLTVAVMGCIVNGPGESRHADIGISLPGVGEMPACPVFIEGQQVATLRGDAEQLATDFLALLDDYVERRFGLSATRP
ncbi:MAG TPA: flavodoxin-dependent (E)-4-hydroxy-3-methylbut-2-enyl-diphosphate synthase [Thermoanaerobaculaceae bacterium]|nr:flavodoxin-dependent (E)-4-hydroxy-3-methylbut-2-enyl-diphosphate synthase [Thermoanaerobaculaceae bacterium]HRS17537.1 flavodoxin-dependent (E)-4-hydroxy-3-methylbut-2-enyl-diphosphate synthase [Thermoanaerobaculaceae bacterium]